MNLETITKRLYRHDKRITALEKKINTSKEILKDIPNIEPEIPTIPKQPSTLRRIADSIKNRRLFSKRPRHYQNNFRRTRYGSTINSGQEVFIKIRGADTITLKLSKDRKLIQIDQSHANDEDKDPSTANLLLKRKYKGKTENLPQGRYSLYIWYYHSSTGRTGTYTQKFFIL